MMEQFYFVITERCNLTCSHCIRDSSPYRDETAETGMIKNALLPDCAQPSRQPGVAERRRTDAASSFPGATRFRAAARTDHHHQYEWRDFVFNEATLKELAQHARLSVQVSLDGDEAMHDAIRGPDSYRKAVRTLRKLVEHGIPCSVSTTVVDIDFMARADTFIAASLDTLGLAHIAIKRATYAGRAASGIDVDGEEWNEHVYRLRALPTKTRLKNDADVRL
jgi:MoaA/NifB/PqqE/SkfB family radical SAM enzyme